MSGVEPSLSEMKGVASVTGRYSRHRAITPRSCNGRKEFKSGSFFFEAGRECQVYTINDVPYGVEKEIPPASQQECVTRVINTDRAIRRKMNDKWNEWFGTQQRPNFFSSHNQAGLALGWRG